MRHDGLPCRGGAYLGGHCLVKQMLVRSTTHSVWCRHTLVQLNPHQFVPRSVKHIAYTVSNRRKVQHQSQPVGHTVFQVLCSKRATGLPAPSLSHALCIEGVHVLEGEVYVECVSRAPSTAGLECKEILSDV